MTDFELLDIDAGKDMRLLQVDVCVNSDEELESIQFTLHSTTSLETLALSTLGSSQIARDDIRCQSLVLTSPLDVVKVSTKENEGVTAFLMAKDD